MGLLLTTNKNYNNIFTVIDTLTKFLRFYPVKNSPHDAMQKLKQEIQLELHQIDELQ